MVRQEELRSRLEELGFDVVRFVRLDVDAGEAGRGLTRWLEAGHHADMDWMLRTADKRQDPQLVLPDARSAILLGINYWPGEISQPTSKWARYTLYQDYHDSVKTALLESGKLLETFYGVRSEQYRYYVDTGPVLERGWAERSGMGFVGKNSMLISRDYGNWLFLAELVTTLDFAADAPLGVRNGDETRGTDTNRVGLYCGRCTRCMDACPTNAIREPGVVDARRCISYQTIENKGIIPRELRSGIGSRIYGCDICLEVCPWNRFAQQSRQILISARYDLAELTLLELLELTPERFAEVFRRTPVKRTKLAGLLRNACIVAANTQSLECLDALLRLATHASPIVRAHATWAVYRLCGYMEGSRRLADARARETDPAVLAEYLAEDAASTAGPPAR